MDKEKDEAKGEKMPGNIPKKSHLGSEKGLIKITSPKHRILM